MDDLVFLLLLIFAPGVVVLLMVLPIIWFLVVMVGAALVVGFGGWGLVVGLIVLFIVAVAMQPPVPTPKPTAWADESPLVRFGIYYYSAGSVLPLLWVVGYYLGE